MIEHPSTYDELLELAMADDDFVKLSPLALTPKNIHDLASECMLNLGRLPTPYSVEIKTLTHETNKIIYHFETYRKHWGPSIERASAFSAALQKLLDTAPTIKTEFIECEEQLPANAIAEQRSKLVAAVEALDLLTSAAERVKASRIAENVVASLPPKPEWEHVARKLTTIFHDASDPANSPDGVRKAAAYRFAASIASIMTGESISFDAVETLIKRNRDVNRGRNFLNLPWGKAD